MRLEGGGDWENCPAAASSSSFAVPGSCQALLSDPRELGSGRPAPPWRPGAPAPLAAAARLSVGAGPVGKRDLGAIDWGHRGEALGKFSELGAGVGGSVKRLQGNNLGLPGWDVTVFLLVSGHRGGWGNNPLEKCAFGSSGGNAATSLLLLSLVWPVRAVLGVSAHTMMAML